jgi:hypothetical protein
MQDMESALDGPRRRVIFRAQRPRYSAAGMVG